MHPHAPNAGCCARHLFVYLWTLPLRSPLLDDAHVQPGSEGQEAARAALRERMSALRLSALDLAEVAGVSYNAINEFLTRRREWPRPKTRAAIERALSWEPGTLERIAAGAALPERGMSSVGGSYGPDSGPDDGGLTMVNWPPDAFRGLTPTERAEAQAAALAAGLERLRQIRKERSVREGAADEDDDDTEPGTDG